MVAEREQNSGRPPLEELSPALRDAVESVLNDPMPEELTGRVLVAARRRVTRSTRLPTRRITSWAVLATAASIALIALAMHFHAGRTPNGPLVQSPQPPVMRKDVPAASPNDLPTAWAYTQAARQSPEALDALLDRHARQSISANPRSSPEQASLRSIRQTL
jgi:hypothetical protein